MVSYLQEIQMGKEGNYLFPFLWWHGEEEGILREYVRKIKESGCGAFCVESRPHVAVEREEFPGFCSEKWWEFMDVILEEARRLDMKVWILDDAHFPTGYANGALRTADTGLRKKYLNFFRTDICGPMRTATLHVDTVLAYRAENGETGKRTEKLHMKDQLLAVIAGRAGEDDRMESLLDITSLIRGGELKWDVPPGYWKVFLLFLTECGGGDPDYINLLDRDSCRLQIDAVYEPHFQRYGSLFGSTIAGFFSDEPAVGNTATFFFDESIGRKQMPLPWSGELEKRIKMRMGKEWKKYLPLLWEKGKDARTDAFVRTIYMDETTKLVENNFSCQIGDWCRAHGVAYIGHMIEDNDQHARLGCSLGHFFRGQMGQDMAGIDNIGNQLLPGGEDVFRPVCFGSAGDGEFFHFLLGKLASSFAHIDPKKKGRALCENFGAYGWGLGVKGMKYLADHFLVRGINRFVPHAFSLRPYPDPDCPPHFYAHGNNPEFAAFRELMRYMNRVCHLLEHMEHHAPVAMLYHGEAEWAGDYMSDKKVARALHENQIDFDIIPADVFQRPDYFRMQFDGTLHIGREIFEALVIPRCAFLNREVAFFAGRAVEKGYPVFFVEKLPEGIADEPDREAEKEILERLVRCDVLTLEELADVLRARVKCDLEIAPEFRRLRYYFGSCEGKNLYVIMNEDPAEWYEGQILLPQSGKAQWYDPWSSCITLASGKKRENGMNVDICIAPLELNILFVDTQRPEDFVEKKKKESGWKKKMEGSWEISIASAREYPAFHDKRKMERLESIAEWYPDFSGYIRYERILYLQGRETDAEYLRLEDCYETARAYVNGADAGLRIAEPYIFSVKGLLQEGENRLLIEVATSLARENRASIEKTMKGNRGASKFMEPTGIVGDVWLEYREEEDERKSKWDYISE